MVVILYCFIPTYIIIDCQSTVVRDKIIKKYTDIHFYESQF